MEILNILKKYFGYLSFKPVQKEIISSIINGERILAVLPTGAGKSLCYQIPAIMGESFSIVISPLIALMKDQVDSLNKNEELAAFINSSLDFPESEKVLYKINNREIKLLYVSPEKLANNYFVQRLKKLKPNYLFIDEAHCISQWGHNFRPSYRRIKEFAEFIGVKNISAFTATATQVVQKDIVAQLGMENPQIFVSGFERENLFLNVVHTKHKKEQTLKLLKENLHPAIVYTATRKNAEELNDFVNLNGIDAEYYHAGLPSAQRKIIQDDFLAGRLDIIIATNAFGMGIDKENIRTIIHYNCPGTIENYYQEIGRAGRNGKIAQIYLLYDLKDKIIQEYFIKNNFPTKSELGMIYNTICDYAEVALGSCPTKEIILEKQFFNVLAQRGIKKLKFNSSLNFLETSGCFEQVSQFRREYFFRFIFNNKELKNYVSSLKNKDLKDFILYLLQIYRAASFVSQVPIDFDKLSKLTSLSKNQLQIYFETLQNIGIITFNKPASQPVLNMLQERIPFNDVKLNMSNLQELLENSYKKLDEMVTYTYTEKCRFNYILTYFGEDRDDYHCGHCDNCLKHNTTGFNEFIEDKILQTIHEAKFIIRKSLLLKILLGQDKTGSYLSLSTYGSCEQYKKHEIESSADALFSKGFLKYRNNSLYLSEKGKSVFVTQAKSEMNSNDREENVEAEQTLELFNKLRESRKWLSKKYSQPVQYICSDEILRKIAKLKPKNSSELISVGGINTRMFNKIGEEFLFEINEFLKRNSSRLKKNASLSKNLTETLSLINKNYKLEEIAKLTKLPESVVYLQIETIKNFTPDLNLSSLLDKKEMQLIDEAAKSNNWENLKQIKEKLPHRISYAKIKVVLLQNGIKF